MPVSIAVADLRVRSLEIDFHEVTWKLAPTSEDVLDYTFQVLRSESPEGPYDNLTPPVDDRYIFIDNTLEVANRWRKYYYKIRIAQKSTGDCSDSDPVSREADPDIITQELRRHMVLLFREFAGRRCWILPARTFGQRCQCWNASLQKRTRSGCELCYDTGFVRGYMAPIETWLQIDPSAKANQHTNVGKQQQQNTTARFGYYPQVKPDDLIIEPENRRWKVVSVTSTEKGRAPIHQEVQLHEVPPRDIEFKVPLNLSVALQNLWLSPSRNYNNPQSLESFLNEEAPNIFALYPSTYPVQK
jgi:hypothetical protein